MTDAQAIDASLADPEVFAVLFDRHFDAIHGYAQRRVGPDLADEIAAETASPRTCSGATGALSGAGSARTRGAPAVSTASSPGRLPPSSPRQ